MLVDNPMCLNTDFGTGGVIAMDLMDAVDGHTMKGYNQKLWMT